MKNYEITITIPRYMQHRMDDIALEAWEKNHGHIIDRPEIPKEDKLRADYHCHRDENDKCFIPCEHLEQAMINGGTQVKSKVGNSRRSMTNIVAGQFSVLPIRIPLREYDEIDKRSAVNKNTGARIITVRPKWNNLEITFTLQVMNDTITPETIKEILYHAGTMFGIGSYRPQNKGKFGVFKVKFFSNGDRNNLVGTAEKPKKRRGRPPKK